MPRNLNYTNSSEEITHTLELFRKEADAERQDFSDKMDTVSLTERISKGVSLYPLEVEDVEFFIGDRWKITLKSKNELPKFHSFSPGTPISFFKETERKYGQIKSISEKEIIAIIDSEVPDWLEEGKIGIDIYYSEKSYKEGERALQRILEDKKDRKEKRDLLLGYITPSPNFESLPDITDLIDKERFNQSQVQAIQAIIETNDSLVIQGPPGTGKTSVLVEAIRILVFRGKKVLISTPTNSALDLLLEKILPHELKPIRIGQTSRVSEDLLSFTIDSLSEKHSLSKTINKFKKQAANIRKKATRFHRNFGPKEREEKNQAWNDFRGIKETIRNTERQLEKELIHKHNPVLATNVSASQAILNKEPFDICILDEATQSLEPIAWIPILRAEKIIFAGDENQLPPTILSGEDDLLNTLFLKATESFRGSKRFQFLNTQYRMEEEILGFSNQEFYGNLVQTDSSVKNRKKIHTPLFSSPLVFIDTAGTGFEEESSKESDSIKNPGEADILVKIIHNLLETIKVEPMDIGIIAPYKEQVFCIREKLTETFTQIEVATVDSFQGREKDIIAVSLTRSNDESEIGFLKDYRRMNVSLTRARKILIVIGDSATLSTDDFYNRFLSYSKEHGDYKSAYEYM
ncbi:MAG: AAA family ATPase [Leptospira sp.]|nr:AAA family ATPase [Leptospira sp.]